MMEIARSIRQELNALSKDVLGTSSRWQKLVNKGYTELVTEEVEETVPAEKEGEQPTTKRVQAPVLSPTGARQYVVKYHTVESVQQLLLEQKAQLDNIRAMIKKQNEEVKAKQEAEATAKQLHQELSGSAT
jgi:hypothetical protein